MDKSSSLCSGDMQVADMLTAPGEVVLGKRRGVSAGEERNNNWGDVPLRSQLLICATYVLGSYS